MANRNIFSDLLNPKSFNKKNGFDLSHRKVFDCKAGELLPVLCEELYPDDYFEIDTATLLRTMPMQTAAFLRARMCFDFFFVPKTALWKRYNSFIAQRDEVESSYEQGYQYEPNITLADISGFVAKGAGNLTDTVDDRARVLSLLGYADGMKSLPPGIDSERSLTVLPIMGYNRIYNFHYRNKWRDAPTDLDAPSYSADFLDCSSYLDSLYPSPASSPATLQLVKMHYHGWFKDLFMGSLPNQQFGVVSSVVSDFPDARVVSAPTSPSDVGALDLSLSGHRFFGVDSASNYIGLFSQAGQASFDVLALRRAIALQKWKEYNMRAGWQADKQQQANFGVDLPSDSRHQIHFIDSYEAPVMVDEVMQTSPSAAVVPITSSPSPVGDIGGKGIGFANGKKISFEAKQPGYLYCIFYIMPEAEYDAYGIDPCLIASEPFDHYTPAFANTGMEAIHKFMLNYTGNPNVFDTVNGYAPNGYKWKTRTDKAYASFRSSHSLSSWVSVRRDLQNIVNSGTIPISYFYVNPSVLDSIFYSMNDGTDRTCQFLVNLNFNVKAVRPMPVLGLPSF